MEPDKDLYFKVRNALEKFAKINNRLEVTGLENVPADGGALLCPCHRNYSDPFYIGAAIPDRMIHFLAWHGIADMPLVGPLFQRIGCMHSIEESYGTATNKEQAKEVLGGMRALLEAGELCCVFPEGTINYWIASGRVDEFRPGAVRLAAEAGVPIIPAALIGTRFVVANIINFHDYGGPDKGIWFPTALPVKVRVKFGVPFYPDPAAAHDPDMRISESARLRDTVLALIEDLKSKSLLARIGFY